jgi:hypothetical protein
MQKFNKKCTVCDFLHSFPILSFLLILFDFLRADKVFELLLFSQGKQIGLHFVKLCNTRFVIRFVYFDLQGFGTGPLSKCPTQNVRRSDPNLDMFRFFFEDKLNKRSFLFRQLLPRYLDNHLAFIYSLVASKSCSLHFVYLS